MKKKTNGQTLFILSSILFLWAFLFIFGLFIHAQILYFLAVGQVFFLLLNIPLGIVSLVWILKKRIDDRLRRPLAVISVMNILIGLADWTFLVLLAHKP